MITGGNKAAGYVEIENGTGSIQDAVVARESKFATIPDDEAASDFDVTPTSGPARVPKVKPEAAVAISELAPMEPNFSNVASLMAPDTDAPIRAAGAHVGPVLKRISAELKAPLAKLKAGSEAITALRADLCKRGLAPCEARVKVENLEREAGTETDPAALEAIASKIAVLRSITPAMEAAASRAVAIKVDELRSLAREIVDGADKLLDGYLAEARKAEKAFFDGHGLPVEPTNISRRVLHAKRRIADMREGLELHPFLPGNQHAWTFDFRSVLHPLA